MGKRKKKTAPGRKQSLLVKDLNLIQRLAEVQCQILFQQKGNRPLGIAQRSEKKGA